MGNSKVSSKASILFEFDAKCFGSSKKYKTVREVLSKHSKLFNGPVDSDFVFRMVINSVYENSHTFYYNKNRVVKPVVNFMQSHLEPLNLLQTVDKDNYMKHLIVSFLEDNLEVAESLLASGAKLELLNYVPPAVYFSAFGGRVNIREKKWTLLVKYVPYSSLSDPENKILSRYLQKFNHTAEDVEFAENIIKSGVSVVEDYEEGEDSPLLCAFFARVDQKCVVSIVSLMIEKGLDVNCPIRFPRSTIEEFPLHCAICFFSEDIVDLLLSHGADIDAKSVNNGTTALHQASYGNYDKMIDLLIRRGVKISAEDNYGRTPFSTLLTRTFRQKNYDQCVLIMIKAFAKITFSNSTVSEIDMNLIKKDSSILEDFEGCLRELDLMAKTEFNAPNSFYSVLDESISIKKLASLLNNEELASSFESNLSNFYYYQDDLKLIWNKATQIRDDFEIVLTRLTSILGKNLIEDIIRILAKNLTPEDLPLE